MKIGAKISEYDRLFSLFSFWQSRNSHRNMHINKHADDIRCKNAALNWRLFSVRMKTIIQKYAQSPLHVNSEVNTVHHDVVMTLSIFNVTRIENTTIDTR